MYVLATMMSFAAGLKERRDERGATAVEYGLLVALIAAVIIAVVAVLGTRIGVAFSKITTQLPGA